MLGKLIKHEFQATAGFIALICVGLLGFAGLTRLFMMLDDSFGLFSFPAAISMFFYVVLAIASVILVYVIIIRRFYSNVYGDEGYLTLTLPVKRRDIILSKLICGIVWILADAIVTAASLILFIYSNDFINKAREAETYINYVINTFIRVINSPEALVFTELAIAAVIGLLNSLLIFYAAISIGQLFSKHRLIGSVIGYIAVNTVIRIVTGLFSFSIGASQKYTDNLIRYIMKGVQLSGIDSFNLQVDVILYLVISAAIAVGLFTLTNAIMKRAVNLQ